MQRHNGRVELVVLVVTLAIACGITVRVADTAHAAIERGRQYLASSSFRVQLDGLKSEFRAAACSGTSGQCHTLLSRRNKLIEEIREDLRRRGLRAEVDCRPWYVSARRPNGPNGPIVTPDPLIFIW